MTEAQLALMLDPAVYATDRRAWKASAARLHFGVCERCERQRDEEGKLLLVARQDRARRFLCFDCFRGEPRRQRPNSMRVRG